MSRTVPFSFIKSGQVDYPATLSLTAYYRDFASLPWAGIASLSNSGSHSFDGASASVGASFGSHPSASFDGASDFLRSGTLVTSDYISAGAFTLEWILQAVTASAADANPDNEPGLFVDYANGYFRVTYSTSGVRAAIFSGGTTSYVALSTGTKACVQCTYDGSTLRIRVNGGSWASIASANIANTTGIPAVGTNYNGTKKFNGRIARFLAAQTALSGTVLDNLYADARSNYGVP